MNVLLINRSPRGKNTYLVLKSLLNLDTRDKTIQELINLSILHPRAGDLIGRDVLDTRAAYSTVRPMPTGENLDVVHPAYDPFAEAKEETKCFFDLMVELDYLKRRDDVFIISVNGWKMIDEFGVRSKR